MNGVKIKRSNNCNIQKYLRDSEIWDTTINLSGRNSLIRNKRKRMFNKLNPYIYWLIWVMLFIAWICITIWLTMRSINIQLPEVNAMEIIQEDYTEEELIEFIEEVEEEYVEDLVEEECDTLCKATEFIADQEGFSEKPYWDHKRYSIWHWTPANGRQHITREQARQEIQDRIFSDIRYLEYHVDDEGLIIALTSFKYNVWSYPQGWKWYIDNWYYNALKNKMKRYVYSNKQYLQWLMNRRLEETSLF